MNWREHMDQADMLLKEAAQDGATAHASEELLRVLISLTAAQVHVQMADLKRVRT